MRLTPFFQVRRDVLAIIRKTEVVDIAVDMMAEKAVRIPHKPMTIPTFGRT